MNYYELNVTSNFSFLQGASHPHELVEQAINLGYSGMAITDECSLAGIVKAYSAVKNHFKQHDHKKSPHKKFKLIIGSRFFVESFVDTQSSDSKPLVIEIILISPCRQSYAELSAIITYARRQADKGEYRLSLDDLQQQAKHCLCIWLSSITNNKQPLCSLSHPLAELSTIFPQRLWIGYARSLLSSDYCLYLQCLQLSRQFNLPIVAHNNILMHSKQRLKLQHCLTAIKNNQTVDMLAKKLLPNAENSFKKLSQLKNLYPERLLLESKKIADLCHFCLTELSYQYPDEVLPKKLSADEYLFQLCMQGANKRWPKGINKKNKKQLDYELSVIKKLRYEHYFLTVYDIVSYARKQHILCQGRGSAANSIVCYCLFITEVDPQQSELLFERFISEERNEPPDIDVDFEHQRREEIIQYIYQKYGRQRAALTAMLITYRFKSAINDVGKALGIEASILSKLSQSLAWWDKLDSLKNHAKQLNLPCDSLLLENFFSLVSSIHGFPRHLSQHVGGFLITQDPISTLVPLENARMPGRTVIQWDKYDIETLGLLKVDVLGLGMLTMIKKALIITQSYSAIKQLADIPKEDQKTYQMLCNADSIGVFQVESRAQMSMLPRLKPQCFYDLVIQIAIVRPGPIQGNMVHPYLKRRHGEMPVEYPNQALKKVLQRTLGVPIFQEQVIQLAMVAAGFTGGQADQLRRAMATWGRNGDLFQFREKLINGMLKRGYNEEYAERIFQQMKGFGSYGFPESHSASFAILAYFSAWLKRHHTAAFYCALLNSQPMGFYSPSQLIQDARRHQLKILPVDIDFSDWDSMVVFTTDVFIKDKQQSKPGAIRLGMHLLKGFNQAAAKRISTARAQQAFVSIKDLVYRCNLNQIEKQALVKGNALPRLAKHRYQAQWQSLAIEEKKPLLQTFDALAHKPSAVELSIQPPTATDDMLMDYKNLGLTLKIHPMELLKRNYFKKNQVKKNHAKKNHLLDLCQTAVQLKNMRQSQLVKVAGVVTGRQRPGTASGVLFITLEDETGNINVIVWKNILNRFRQTILGSRLLLIKGRIEKQKKVTHVIAGYIEDISHQLPGFSQSSRDFH